MKASEKVMAEFDGLAGAEALGDGDAAAEGRVLAIAVDIARRAPKRQGKYVTNAGIPWSLIRELRAELDEMGLDWST